jgi:hypothetical protein
VPAPLPGDYNGDTVVDLADYTQWRTDFGSTIHLMADGNRNGIVDAADYVFWRNIFSGLGSGAGLGNSAGVPEPNAAFLSAMAVTWAALASPFLRRRRAR